MSHQGEKISIWLLSERGTYSERSKKKFCGERSIRNSEFLTVRQICISTIKEYSEKQIKQNDIRSMPREENESRTTLKMMKRCIC